MKGEITVRAIAEIVKRRGLYDYCGHYSLWVMFLSAYSQAPGIVLAVVGVVLHFGCRWAALYNMRPVSVTLFMVSLIASSLGFIMYLLRDAANLPPMGVS